MKWNWLSTLLFLLLMTFSLVGQTIDDVTWQMPYERFSLENGLQVLLQPDTARTEVAVEFWVKGGTAQEAIGEYGMAHFYEHVTPYGLRGEDEKWAVLKPNMTDGNAQTSKDFIRYYIQVKPLALELALESQADRLSSQPADITDHKVAYERDRVLREIERQSSKPLWNAAGASALFLGTFGQGHPYGHGGYHSVKNNETFEPEVFRSWHQQYMDPCNALLFVVGNFNADSARMLIQHHFGQMLNDGPCEPLPAIVKRPYPKPIRCQANTAGKEHYLAQVWEVPAYGTAELPALKLLSVIMEQQIQADSLKQDFGAESPAGTLFRTYKESGQLVYCAPFSNLKDTLAVRQYLERSIQSLLQSGIDSRALNSAKEAVSAAHLKKLNRLGFLRSRVELLGEGLLYLNNPDYYLISMTQLLSVTPEEVDVIARKWLSKPHTEVLLIGEPTKQH